MILQQDIIKINGKKIFINPFLYSRKFDEKTKIWLRNSGQISQSKIDLNRSRFYPDINWEILSLNEKLLKDTTIELFLKTIEIIKIFHPYLKLEELLEVEKKLIYYKKIAFEKWSRKEFIKKNRLLINEKRKLKRDNFFNTWYKWLALKETQKVLFPIFVIILTSTLIGWFAGVSKNSCNPYFESSFSNQL
tara:strand:- start:1177 stop:1749 length:573 start_codon:yes stop_codon:yes gene_type:complete